ncbi:squalene/phytoene synthase family protein [Streptomyces sp. NPDC001205]
MPPRLNEAVTCAYLMMRAIDEIEDHPGLDGPSKALLLRGVSRALQTRGGAAEFAEVFRGQEAVLPDVTLRLGEWVMLAAPEIGPRVWETFATMAERMATWAENDFAIHTEHDLDQYTYAVAGTVVLVLSDLWSWYDGTQTNRTHGIGYGRALQAVNILIDRAEDTGRGVDFWPDGWQTQDMLRYARQELALADAYLSGLQPGPARTFCAEPLSRAHRALALQPWTPTPRKPMPHEERAQ